MRKTFDAKAQEEFLNGAKIAYETIITDFSDNDNKLIESKPLLSKKIYEKFNEALEERNKKGHYAEITFNLNTNELVARPTVSLVVKP